MALKKRNIDIPLAGGLNQKVTSKLLAPPSLLKLENGRYLKEGRISKRYGYTNLGQAVNTGTLNTPSALGAIRDELLMISADSLYTYSNTDSKWYRKGELSIGSTNINQISASPMAADGVDVVTSEGVRCAVWLEGTTYYYSVFDENTKAAIVDKATLVTSAGSIYPRLVAVTGNIYILYNSGTNLVYLRIPTSEPNTSSTANLYTTLDSSGAFDAYGLGDHFYLVFRITGTGNARISKVNQDATVVATQTIVADFGAHTDVDVLAFNSESANKVLIYLGWVDSSNNIKTQAFDINLVSQFTAATIETLANVNQLIITPNSTDGSTVGYFTAISAGDTKDYYIRKATVDTSGTITGTGTFMRSVGLASRGAYKDGVSYFNVLHDSTLQPTYFTVTDAGKVVAKFAASEGGDHSSTRRPSNFSAVDSTAYIWGLLKKGRIQSENATLFAILTPQVGTLSLDAAKSSISTIINDDYLIAGGILRSYDGQSATEYGFHLFPEDVSLAETTGGGLPTTSGPYSIQVIYEWTDARGVRTQSAPSVAQTITLTGSNTQIDVTVPALRVTDKSPDTGLISRSDIKVRAFMTEASGTVHYFNVEVDNPDITSTDSVTLNITTAADTSKEILYTSGGIVENIAPPSHNYIFTHDNRPIILGLEDPNQIRFGKDIKPLTGVGFNEDFVINLDPLGGDTIAGASMDNYMIIFKETATYAISGSGPNDAAQGSTYSTPQLISSDIGCKDPKSVLQTPDGIMLKTNKGIYLLTRSLEFLYLGAAVEDFNSTTIVSSDILKDSNEIRFVTNDSVTLVYNYFFKRWSTFTTPGALDATTWQASKYVYLTSSKVMQEDANTYLDDGSYVKTKIRTGWIRLTGLQGFQRVYRAALIGEYHNDHTFQVKQYYDYSDIVRATTNITASTLINTSTYGDSTTYGSDDFFGGSENDEVYQTRIHLLRQKCESISLEIEDALNGANAGQGFSLEGISLLVGGKSGLFRTNSTRTQ